MQPMPPADVEFLEPRRLFASAFSNVNVSRTPGNHAEGTIAIDPTNPSRLFAASNAPGTGLLGSTSVDGGATWSSRAVAPETPLPGEPVAPACCDPSTAFDEFGNLYLTYAHEEGLGVSILLSTDAGATFRELATFEGDLDQPTVTTGPGSVWVTFKRGGAVAAAGASVQGVGVHTGFQLFVLPGSRFGNFGDIAVGAAGQVAVAYQQGTKLSVNMDPDGLGPLKFGRRVPVVRTNVGGFDEIPAQRPRGIDAEAGLAFDRSGGQFNGRLYLVHTEEQPDGSDNTDIILRYSDDSGSNWSAPARVNTDLALGSQFLPRMVVDDTSGEIGFSWYDTRSDPGEADTNGVPGDDALFYAARARPAANGILLADDAQVSVASSNAAASQNSIDLGDYTGLAFRAGVMYPLWADNSNSTGNNPDGRLSALDQYTARVAAAALPEPSRLHLGSTPGGFRAVMQSPRRTFGIGGKPDFRFKVTYSTAADVDATSLDGDDLLVTGPNGYSVTPQVLSVRGRGPSRTVTYSVPAPGGRWTAANSGVYLVAVNPGAVRDVLGPQAGGTIGYFAVRTRLSA